MKNVLILFLSLAVVALVGAIVWQRNQPALKAAEDAKVALVGSLVTPHVKPATRPLELVIVDGDEMPGIGADKVRPDTCLAYLDSNNIVHLSYAK